MPRANSSQHVTVVDAASLFDATELIAERHNRSKVTIQYNELKNRLDEFRRAEGWPPAVLNVILLSLDPASEGQQRFKSMLSHAGFEPDVVPYRDAFVSLPPGRSPAESSAKPITSFAARIAYIAGLMTRYDDASLIVVSHAFELCSPLADLAERLPKRRVGIAYFASLMDFRWRSAGLFDDELPISFFDLDPFGLDLMGIDLGGKRGTFEDRHLFLSRF